MRLASVAVAVLELSQLLLAPRRDLASARLQRRYRVFASALPSCASAPRNSPPRGSRARAVFARRAAAAAATRHFSVLI